MSKLRLGAAALWIACLSSACGHAPKPAPASRPVHWSRHLLLERASGSRGNLSHVSEGLWCAADGAFSLPVAPFPEGPTELYGNYIDHGVTSMLKMLDANESVVEIVRTQIRPELPADEVLPGVAQSLERGRRVIPSLRFAWIEQRGRTQIESVNSMEDYGGRQDIVYLAHARGTNYDPQGACRVDRHFVGEGYYFQIIAVAYRPEPPKVPTPPRDNCAFALELAAWAAEHICLGTSCCAGAGAQPHTPAKAQ